MILLNFNSILPVIRYYLRSIEWYNGRLIRCYSSIETRQDKWVIESLNGKENGFFIDLGASNGLSSNNTYTLEKYYGWNGILIEGSQVSYQDLIKNRPDQICVNAIVSDQSEDIVWRHNINMDTRSGIEDTLPPDNDQKSWRVGEKVIRRSETLGSILRKNNCPRLIDFLTVDIEGGEINALKNFPFENYQINLISIESGYKNIKKITDLLQNNGFKKVANKNCKVNYEHFFVNKNIL